LWARRKWIIACAVLFTVPFALAAFLAQPLYSASTVLADARSDVGASSLNAALSALGTVGANLARISAAGATFADEAMAVLRSREFTERFIRERNLMPKLFPDLWDENAGGWRVPDEEAPTLAQAFMVFNDLRAVSQAGRGGLVTVSVSWRDPVEAAEWANALVAQLNAEMRARAIASTTLSVSYLEKELAATSTIETRQSINRLMEAQINQRMVANVTEEFAFRVVDRALPPDPDDTISPSKILIVALGPTIGLIFGVFAVLAANVFAARRKARLD
jgi:uncharacterized protein involved in exopolysaccharide biosynthesis